MDGIFHHRVGCRGAGWLIILAFLLHLVIPARTEQPTYSQPFAPAELCKLELGEIHGQFDLCSDQDLIRLNESTAQWLRVLEIQRNEETKRREAVLVRRPLAEIPQPKLEALYNEPSGMLTRKDQRGLEQLQRLSALALQEKDPGSRNRHLVSLAEVAEALNLNRRPPIPSQIDLVELPFIHYRYAHNRIAIGNTPAWNLDVGPRDPEADSSRLNPESSSFWTRPSNIPSLNLFDGYGRLKSVRIDDCVLDYDEPKTSFGGHAGFVAKYGSLEVKVKFGEVHSEPFAARLFWALGYNVEATDYASQLRLRYDRRLFRDFNQRREVSTQISALAILPIYRLQFQPRHDPFQFIAAAVMKDGTRLSSAELKVQLYRDPEQPSPADDPGNFRPEFERTIDYLITVPANVQIKDPKAKNIGPWAFGGLGHEGRRELRGAGMLAAWIGWFDSRFDNTRLKIVRASGDLELKHYFSDLGGGLGRSTGLVYRQGELPNEFGWTFTQAPKLQGKGRMTIPFRVVGYRPIEDTPAFEQMTADDARWMARWIGQLTERQIVEALVAAGFDAAHVRLYTEKLVNRRDRMVCDLALDREISLMRPGGVDRHFSYDPVTNEPVTATTAGGQIVKARASSFTVRQGVLVSTGPAKAEGAPHQSNPSRSKTTP